MFVNNTIVQESLHNPIYIANTVIGHKLAFFRYHFNMNLSENDINFFFTSGAPRNIWYGR